MRPARLLLIWVPMARACVRACARACVRRSLAYPVCVTMPARALFACHLLARTTSVCITKECMWPDEYKQRAVESTELDTIILNRKLGDPTRFYRNTTRDEVVYTCQPEQGLTLSSASHPRSLRFPS